MRKAIVFLGLILGVCPLGAWNGTGHKAVALIAYERLNPAVKARVDALLAKHPDYGKWTSGVSDAAKGRAAFLAASIWPDVIKGDPRFFDPDRPKSSPTLPGFPDMERHRNWHYLDRPYNPENLPIPAHDPVNAEAKLKDFIDGLSSASAPDPVKAFLMPWLIHVEGDVHQPLHTTSRYTSKQEKDANGKFKGDAGGNGVSLKGGSNLHSFWDGVTGSSETDEFLNVLVATARKRNPAPATISIDPATWIDESNKLAIDQVYRFRGVGTKEQPVTLSDSYKVNAKRTGLTRVAMGGYRLAEVLNQKLK